MAQQRARLLVGLRRRHDADVHAARLVDLAEIDLGEDQLVAQTDRVIAAPVEAFGETPRKSRTRGSAMLMKRSRNSYIRSPRSVTIAPMLIPSRSLNAAIDFFALVTTGRCPDDRRQIA